ncbi:MAG: hypothetical protein ACK5LY_05405, partial [Lachnospirales bacterium]
KSFFPFADRIELVKKGTSDLENVTVIPSGKYIISSLTFSDYFNKEKLQEEEVDMSADVELFADAIAPALNISVRFVGEEPLDKVTRQYNQTMQMLFPKRGIDLVIIPRKEFEEQVISASLVRELLKEKKFFDIAEIVPSTTLDYLVKNFLNHDVLENKDFSFSENNVKTFEEVIAPTLNITKRYVSENSEEKYLNVLDETLKNSKVELVKVKKNNNNKSVKKVIEDKDFSELRKLVPEKTANYLENELNKKEL